MSESAERPVLLMVEDDPSHARLIQRCLTAGDIDFDIRHVTDGHEALDYLFRRGPYADPSRSPRPQLVFLDLRLPRCDGFEVLERAKTASNTQTIPIVVLTTSAAERDVVGAYERRANGYLVKPVDAVAMQEMLSCARAYWLRHNRTVGLEEAMAS